MSSLGVSGSRSNSHHESLSLRSMSRTLSADVESNAANHATRNPDDFVSANANTQRVQRAVSKAVSVGKSISGLLSDALEQSSLARNEDSNLHILVELAAGLQNYQSPIEFTIGFVGDSGVGLYHFQTRRTPLTGLQVKAAS
jgi:hypothetical protein